MEKKFIRAKSAENKEIRIHQIMDVTEELYKHCSYHEISLSIISEKAGFARGGLYKYVSSKEEIFLLIYREKQKKFLEELTKKLHANFNLSHAFPSVMEQNLDFLKYHHILNAIIETNITVENLIAFKTQTDTMLHQFLEEFNEKLQCDYEALFNMYLTFVYYGVYLYDRCILTDTYLKTMKIANLPIVELSFQEAYTEFINMFLAYHFPKLVSK